MILSYSFEFFQILLNPFRSFWTYNKKLTKIGHTEDLRPRAARGPSGRARPVPPSWNSKELGCRFGAAGRSPAGTHLIFIIFIIILQIYYILLDPFRFIQRMFADFVAPGHGCVARLVPSRLIYYLLYLLWFFQILLDSFRFIIFLNIILNSLAFFWILSIYYEKCA